MLLVVVGVTIRWLLFVSAVLLLLVARYCCVRCCYRLFIVSVYSGLPLSPLVVVSYSCCLFLVDMLMLALSLLDFVCCCLLCAGVLLCCMLRVTACCDCWSLSCVVGGC